MRSALPKVLQPLAGRPLLEHVLLTVAELGDKRPLVVHGHCAEQVRERFSDWPVEWVLQAERLGTGHAVTLLLPYLSDDDRLLVLYGDVPLIRPETLAPLVEPDDPAALALLTMTVGEPEGYGRILRDPAGEIVGIVEERDATDQQRSINEVNTGILSAPVASLRRWLSRLDNSNAQGEYYLTDVVSLAVEESCRVVGVDCADPLEALGVNDPLQLAKLERTYQIWNAIRLLQEGVRMADPARIDIRGQLRCGDDCMLDINLVVEGEVELGNGVEIGPNCQLINCKIGDGVKVKANCVVEGAVVGDGAVVGPFARLRPGCELADGSRVGNFVEIKNSRIGRGSKVNHLSYIGDTDMGEEVNIGAGTITCNYDGANKHRTRIGNRAFVGSDSQLVAPVEVGEGATIGAGSTITRDAPPEALTVGRAKQVTIRGWKRPKKETR